MQLFYGNGILWWPTDRDGQPTGEVIVLPLLEEDTGRTDCRCGDSDAGEETP